MKARGQGNAASIQKLYHDTDGYSQIDDEEHNYNNIVTVIVTNGYSNRDCCKRNCRMSDAIDELCTASSVSSDTFTSISI